MIDSEIMRAVDNVQVIRMKSDSDRRERQLKDGCHHANVQQSKTLYGSADLTVEGDARLTVWILMNKRNAILTVDYDEEIHAFSRILDVSNPELAPFAARETNGTISRSRLQNWWNERAIPATRDDFRKLRDGLNGTSPMSLLEGAHGLSLTDQFWMRREDDERSWDEVNFFTNGFGPELGYLTLGSFSPSYREVSSETPSPNSSLGGNLKKAWEMKNGEPILVKAGADPLRLEPYSELVATRLYGLILEQADYVPYELENRDGRPYSTCPCMVDESESFVPMRDIIEAYKRRGSESPWLHLLSCCRQLGLSDAELPLSKLFVCDYLLANSDRHWGNFGVVFDTETMTAKRAAPIFDSGAALWSRVAVLDSEIDFWYRPLPLIPERARRIYPEDQLSLIKRRDWLDCRALDDFEDIVRDILGKAAFNQPARIDAICRRVRQNISRLTPSAHPRSTYRIAHHRNRESSITNQGTLIHQHKLEAKTGNTKFLAKKLTPDTRQTQRQPDLCRTLTKAREAANNNAAHDTKDNPNKSGLEKHDRTL